MNGAAGMHLCQCFGERSNGSKHPEGAPAKLGAMLLSVEGTPKMRLHREPARRIRLVAVYESDECRVWKLAHGFHLPLKTRQVRTI